MSLWIDSSDALERLAAKKLEPDVSAALRDLIVDGVAVLKGVHSAATCNAVIEDYQDWSEQNAGYVKANLDALGRPSRLVNFHLHSPNARALSMNERVHKVLDEMFDSRSCVYTSLTFKFGTQQPVHRDTPHFATWPASHFAGVWTALEDVSADAGPLFYYKGAHRMQVAHPREFMRRADERIANAELHERLFMALDLYNGAVIRQSQEFGEPVTLPLNQGDVVIWHPEMPHGGSRAIDPMRTRWSIVCHCAPERVQVHQHQAFFQHEGPEAPPPRYGYLDKHSRKIALAGDVAFMQ